MSEGDTGGEDKPVAKKVVVKKTVVRKPAAPASKDGATQRPVARPKTPRSEAAARAAAQAAAAHAAQRPDAKTPKKATRRRTRPQKTESTAVTKTAGPTTTPATSKRPTEAEPLDLENPPAEPVAPTSEDAAARLRSHFEDSDPDDVPKPPKMRRNPLAGIASGARRATAPFRAIGRRIAELFQAIIDWFILFEWPRLNPVSASAVSGALAGITAAAAGYGFMVLFAATLGTPSGGGRYGSLALLGVATIVVLVGRALLIRQDVPQPGMTSFLGIIVTLIAILVFFLDLSGSAWGWVLLPVLMAGSFAGAHALLAAADGEPADEEDEDQPVPHDVR